LGAAKAAPFFQIHNRQEITMSDEYDRTDFIGAAQGDPEKPGAPKPAYVHQHWPALRYGPDGKERKVKSQKEADALGPDWHSTPPLPEKDDDEAGPARAAQVRTKSQEEPAAPGKKAK
jgi:hypothetical protein